MEAMKIIRQLVDQKEKAAQSIIQRFRTSNLIEC
jgi:hypothetical protein